MVRARAALDAFIPEEDPLDDFSQSSLSARINKCQADIHFQSADNVNRARLIATSRKHAPDFLFAPPIASLGLKLNTNEWNVAVAYKLGLHVFSNPFRCGANGCSKNMDLQGLHTMRCGTEGDRIKRHNKLRNFFFSQCKLAGQEPLLEPTNLMRNCGLKPADWGIPEYRNGKFMAYDVAVTDPTQVAFVENAAITSGYAADAYAKIKLSKYADGLEKDDSILFAPIIAETFGGWNKDAADFISNLSSWLAVRDRSLTKPLIQSRLYQRMSVILQRGNARMMLSRMSSSNHSR
jgi:hypothetical protein